MLKITSNYLNAISRFMGGWDTHYNSVSVTHYYSCVLYNFKPYAKFMKNHDMLNVPYKVTGV